MRFETFKKRKDERNGSLEDFRVGHQTGSFCGSFTCWWRRNCRVLSPSGSQFRESKRLAVTNQSTAEFWRASLIPVSSASTVTESQAGFNNSQFVGDGV